jgi:hypothetical protein
MIVMIIGLQTVRGLRASELDQVAGGGGVYLGDGNSFVRPSPPHTPLVPINPPTNPPAGGGSGGSGGGGLVGRQPPRIGGHGIYLY